MAYSILKITKDENYSNLYVAYVKVDNPGGFTFKINFTVSEDDRIALVEDSKQKLGEVPIDPNQFLVTIRSTYFRTQADIQ